MTAAPETCPLCGQRALIDQGDAGVVCAKCASAYEIDDATGRRRYTRVSARFKSIESRLSGAWLGSDEVADAGRALVLQRARWLVALSAGVIVTVAVFACALGGAFALAPGIRDSQARIAQSNTTVTGTLTLTPTISAGVSTLRPAATVTSTAEAPSRSPSPTSPGPLNSPVPTPVPTPATRAPASTGTQVAPGGPAVPTQRPTESPAPVVLPPTFTPAATLRLATATLAAAENPTTQPFSPTATLTGTSEAAPMTPTLDLTAQFTTTPTPTPGDPTPTATATATATPPSGRSQYFGQVLIRNVNYRGTPSLNESDEFIELQNTGVTNVGIQGWIIRHRQGASTVAVPSLTLLAGQTCRIYTAPPAPSGVCGPITFGNFQNLWPNDVDALSLFDGSSLLVGEYAYP